MISSQNACWVRGQIEIQYFVYKLAKQLSLIITNNQILISMSSNKWGSDWRFLFYNYRFKYSSSKKQIKMSEQLNQISYLIEITLGFCRVFNQEYSISFIPNISISIEY